jgi:hypothetical protein
MASATRRALLAGMLAAGMAASARSADSPWSRLRRGGLVLLVRAGALDPVGERLRTERVPIERVYASPDGSCRGNALAAFGRADEWTALAAFGDDPVRQSDETQRVRKRIGNYSSRALRGNVVMVTHRANIAALTGIALAEGEVLLVKPDGCCGVRRVERLRP